MKRFLKASLMTGLVVGLMAFAVSAVRADTVTFTTTGTFSGLASGTGGTSTAGNGTMVATANFGDGTGSLLQLRFEGSSQSAIAPPAAGVSLGIFRTAFTGSGSQTGSGTLTLTINQTSPSGASGFFTGTIAANFSFTTAGGGMGTVTFTPTSTTIGGVLYTLSNSGVVTITVPPNGTGTFSNPGNSVEATVNVVVPEPASMLLLGTGLAGIAGVARRKLKARNLN